MIGLTRIVDGALGVRMVPSFTRVGYDVRSRLEGWTPLDRYDLGGRTVLITGATSGLGLYAAAHTLAACGVHDDPARARRRAHRAARVSVVAATGNEAVAAVVADMADLDSGAPRPRPRCSSATTTCTWCSTTPGR